MVLAMEAGLTRQDLPVFLQAYFQQDLEVIFRAQSGFLKAVDRAASKLYVKDHGHNPPENTWF